MCFLHSFLSNEGFEVISVLHCKCAFEKLEIANFGSQEPFYVVYNSSFVQTISG